jgi:hypothetical protein
VLPPHAASTTPEATTAPPERRSVRREMGEFFSFVMMIPIFLRLERLLVG